MPASPTTPRPPSTSRLTLLMAGLAGPLNGLASVAVAIALAVMGLAKFLQGAVDAPLVGADGAGARLLDLATGGIITAPWGHYLIGALQIVLGIGLLVPAARPLAALGCLLSAAAVAVGGVVHRADLTTSAGLNPAGVAVIALVLILLCAAALGARSAAIRVGAAA